MPSRKLVTCREWFLHWWIPHIPPRLIDKNQQQRKINGKSSNNIIPKFRQSAQGRQRRECIPSRTFRRVFPSYLANLTNRDNNGKRITLKLLLCSIYHLVDNDKYECFNTELDTILGSIPSDRSILIGHNMNANIGTVTPIIYNSGLYIIGPGK